MVQNLIAYSNQLRLSLLHRKLSECREHKGVICNYPENHTVHGFVFVDSPKVAIKEVVYCKRYEIKNVLCDQKFGYYALCVPVCFRS